MAASVQAADLLGHRFLALAADPSTSTSALREEAQRLQESSVSHADAVKAKQASVHVSIEALLQAVEQQKAQLVQLPDEVGSIEDGTGDLCTELTGDQGDGEDAIVQGEGVSRSLLQTLNQQRALLAQLENVRDYLCILARAEELKAKALESQQRGANEEALTFLVHLAEHARSVDERLSDANTTTAIAFVHAQKSQAFSALAKLRQDRLSSALTAVEWPPPPPELQQTGEKVSNEDRILGSKEVRIAWRELMKLQKKSEEIGVLPRCSSRIALDSTISGGRPGSPTYQPLLAVQCLLKPLLLRFYYHFDSSRSTNRLDKPEWYLSHILSLLRTHSTLFDPYTGAVAVLCNNRARHGEAVVLRYDLTAELIHGLMRPLTAKLEGSIPLLLQNTQLLSHTIMQAVQFDQDVRAMLSPVITTNIPTCLADSLLSNETVFEAWVQSERTFVSDRLNEELESPTAWLVGDDDDVGEAGATTASGSWAAMQQDGAWSKDGFSSGTAGAIKTTRSARALSNLIDGLTVRYQPLSSISHQLPFLLIQVSVLQAYAQRLERSLDAFESMSSAFVRAIPGGVGGGGGGVPDVNDEEGDMVRGLRGLSRLIKTCVSALYMSAYLEDLSSQSSFLIMGASLANSAQGAKLLSDFRKWEGEEEERKLDQASLGELVRRGWRTGGRFASGIRPLTTTNNEQQAAHQTAHIASTIEASIDVWSKCRTRFIELAKRSQRAIEKLIVSEVLESLRTYSQRSWDDSEADEVIDETEAIDESTIASEITPSLLASLSTLALHLSHMVPSLPRVQANEVYRAVAHALSAAVVERVIMVGGSHRFSQEGATSFARDVRLGWLGVVTDVNERLRSGQDQESGDGISIATTGMGARPMAPWAYLSDSATLISLSDDDGDHADDGNRDPKPPTLQQACRAAFEPTMAGPSWEQVVEALKIDDRLNLRLAREILRRRIDCPW